jgi:4-hydroxybenzoyl-CoA reductase subunit beta
MLPLPIFQHHRPATLAEAVQLMGELGDQARIVAGGTDIVPNMKHGLVEPEHLVSLGGVRELEGVSVTEAQVEIGALTKLAAAAAHPAVARHAPALAQALGAVAGPHHRRMGTVGGNVCLDTRCVYYNQTYFWRQALGFCIKKDGTACHVVSSGKNCVAAASNDSAPALMVLGAEIDLIGPAGERTIAADDFYTPDGVYNTVKLPAEIVTRVRVPITPARVSAFEKLRRRGAIDYPLLNTAARIDREDDGSIAAIDVVVSALAARPKRIKPARLGKGTRPSDALWSQLAEAAFKQCRPLTNIDNDAEWRREMVRVLVKRALSRAASSSE